MKITHRFCRAALRHAITLFAAAMLIAALLPRLSPAQDTGSNFYFGGLAGESVGLDDGYTRLGAFVPLWQQENMVLFSDTHVLLYNEQSEARGANLGGGVRYYDASRDRIFGGYVYYDFRDGDLAEYDQVGFGLETLGSVFDARINVNLPTNTNDRVVGTSILAAPVFGGPVGQNIVLGADLHQQGVRVVDVEAGALLLANEQYQLKGYAGTYGLFADGIDELGVRARMEVRAYDAAWIGGYVQNDDVFGTTAGATLEVRFGGGWGNSLACTANRLTDPVQRRRHVAVRDSRTDVLATQGGAPITVLHVDSNAAADGTGGFMDPVDTLAEASNQPQDIVFVHGDSIFTGESMFISTAGQRFLGEGVPHVVMSDQGNFLLPGVNPMGASPQINDAPANAVTIAANNVEVSGFQIARAGVNGIASAPLTAIFGFSINRNEVTESAVGINVLAAGTGLIADNVTNNNQLGGISVIGLMFGDISGNTANENGLAGGIFVRGGLNGNLENNTTNGNQGDGIFLQGGLAGNLSNNDAASNFERGIFIDANVVGDISNNTTFRNDDGGLFVDGEVAGNIDMNTANENLAVSGTAENGLGLSVTGNVMGSVTNNTANGNRNGGIVLGGEVSGDVTDNTANDNLLTNSVGDGINIRFGVGGELARNDGNNNARHGIVIGDGVAGDVTFNVTQENLGGGMIIGDDVGGVVMNNSASLNQNNGISIFGDITGTVARNTTNDNMQSGLVIDGNIGDDLFRNTADGNQDDGILVLGNVNGNVRSNFTDFNVTGFGVRVDGDLIGSLLANFADNNGIDGVKIEQDVTNNVLGNSANFNGDDGIDVDGVIGGSIGGNLFIGNGDQGLEN